MKNRKRYPKDWEAIALRIKQNSGWKCELCGLECFPSDQPTNPNIGRSLRAKFTLTVHHKNYKPEDNRDENLIALCSGCHLRQHRNGRGNVPAGQMELFNLD